jgi:anti-anti-sigma factor
VSGFRSDGLQVARGADGSVVVSGDVDLATARIFEMALLEATEGDGDVVVDLAGVSFMDSSGLNVFVRCHKALDGTGQRLVVRRPQPMVRQVLEIGGITAFVFVED